MKKFKSYKFLKMENMLLEKINPVKVEFWIKLFSQELFRRSTSPGRPLRWFVKSRKNSRRCERTEKSWTDKSCKSAKIWKAKETKMRSFVNYFILYKNYIIQQSTGKLITFVFILLARDKINLWFGFIEWTKNGSIFEILSNWWNRQFYKRWQKLRK